MSAAARRAHKLAERVARETTWAQARRIDAKPMRLEFTLPWPPSVNHYWRTFTLNGHATVSLSSDGKAYRKDAIVEVLRQRVPRWQLAGKLGVVVEVFPPDRGAHDLDNLGKGIFDSLRHADVIRDDKDIDDLRYVRRTVTKGGALRLDLWEIPGPTETLGLPLAPRLANALEAFE